MRDDQIDIIKVIQSAYEMGVSEIHYNDLSLKFEPRYHIRNGNPFRFPSGPGGPPINPRGSSSMPSDTQGESPSDTQGYSPKESKVPSVGESMSEYGVDYVSNEDIVEGLEGELMKEPKGGK